MPGINDDYEVVIGVSVQDHTTPGLSSVEKNLKKSADDIRKYGDKQARDFAKNSRDAFNKTDQDMVRSSGNIVKKLVNIFDTHNFLLRNMARQAGFTTGSILLGVGKMALSYQRLGKDSEEGASRARIALQDLKTAVGRLGSDGEAFKNAIKATRDLSNAYQDMGKSGHAASVKAGSALEEAVQRRIVGIQNNLLKAQTAFERLRTKGSYESQILAAKISDISASLKHLLGGAIGDASFFRSFIKAEDQAKKYLLVLDKLGPRAALAFQTNSLAIDKLATSFVKLEARSGRFVSTQSERMAGAAAKVAGYQKELKAITTGIEGVGAASEESAPAVAGFLSSLGGVGIVAGVVVAALLLVVAAIIGLGFAMYKGAKTATEYGDELYKLSVSTGLSVKNLSVLSIIARETGTEIDSLAKTFVRTQIQIQRGLDKPYSEAGRAIRTLKVNMQDLRKANPDQQVFTLAKAFSELNNQNVRATVSTQLFSRDAEKQSKMLFEIANGYSIAAAKAKRYGLEMDESGAVKSHLMAVAVADLSLAWEGLWTSLGTQILPQLTILMEKFAESVASSSGAFHFLGEVASVVLTEIRIQLKIIQEQYDMRWGIFEQVYKGMTTGKSARDRAKESIAAEDAQQKKEYDARIEELKKLQTQGRDQYAPGKGSKGPESYLEQLIKQIKKLREELGALQDAGSYINALRNQLELLQKAKAGYEGIYKLRQEMGLSLTEPMPKFRIFGTFEEQQEDMAGLQSYIKQMERMKSVFEGVVKVTNEQADALAELARVTQEALLPVVDAGTLAEIKYQTAFRNRIKAEKELTADVISEGRLRADAVKDEVGNILRAYMTLKRDVGREQDKTRTQTAEDTLFNQIMGGQINERELQEKLAPRVGPIGKPIVPDELTTIAAHAATIDSNVYAIAEKLGANPVGTTTTAVKSAPDANNYSYTKLVRRNEDGTVTVLSQEDMSDPDTEGSVIKTDTNLSNYLKEQIINAAREKAIGNRVTETRKANEEILANTQAMGVELIDIDIDYQRHLTAQNVTRRQEARDTNVSIMLLNKDLSDQLRTDSQLYIDTWRKADESRLNSLKSLRDSNIQLQNEIYNNGYDLNDRLTHARLQAVRDIQEASTTAQESIIANQVKIADATVYHAEIADAAVMEFLAHQKSITDIIGDAKVQVIQVTFDAIDQGLSKLTEKLGFAKDLVKDVISGFVRMALNPFFRMLFGGSGNQGMGGGGTFGTGGGGVFGTGGAGPTGGQAGLSAIPGMIQNLAGGSGAAGLSTPAAVSSGGATWASFGKNMGGLTPGNFLQASKMSQFKTGIAGALPLLGLSLGAQAGGQSTMGSILGGAGGLIAGGVGMAALLGTGAGSIFGAGGTLASLGGVLTGLSATGVLLPIAGALLAGAIILKINKERRKNEEIRNDLSIQTVAGLESMYQEALGGNLTPAEAEKKFADLKAQYFENISGFDSKTKRIATDWWYGQEHPPQVYWNKIKAAAEKGEVAQNIRDRMVPVFNTGGVSTESQLIKVRPGEGVRYPGSNVVHTVFGKDKGYDTEYMYAPQGTRILNQGEMRGAQPFQSGGTVGTGIPDLVIDRLELNIDADGIASIVISSPQFKKAVIRNVNIGKKEKKVA